MTPRKDSVSTVKADAKPDTKDAVWRVVAQTGRVGRVVFRGNEADVRQYVENNYPRPHVDEFTSNPDQPVHDVKVLGPGNVEEVFNAGHGWIPKPDYNADSNEGAEAPETEDEYA